MKFHKIIWIDHSPLSVAEFVLYKWVLLGVLSFFDFKLLLFMQTLVKARKFINNYTFIIIV